MKQPGIWRVRKTAAAIGAGAVITLTTGAAAFAQSAAADLSAIQEAIAAQAKALSDQRRQLDSQAATIDAQRRQIDALQAQQDRLLERIRAAGVAPTAEAAAPTQIAQTDPAARAQDVQGDPGSGLPIHPVGEAPVTTPTAPTVIAALPQAVSVLTRARHFVFDSSLEYDRSSSNRLVFSGIEIVPGINLGLVNANAADRDVVVAAEDVRYGVTSRLEIEARVPYVYRHDLLTTLAQQVTNTTPAVNQTQSLSGAALGDIEIAARYQLNQPTAGMPFFIAGIRAKSRTGIGPYDVKFDANGISQNLATGSGFWGVEPSMTMLLPSDPVVIFATLGYLKNFSRDINRDLVMANGGATRVGRADAGDAVNASIGFGFALNDRFSFSLGYSHSYVFESDVFLNDVEQKANALQVGSLNMGWSYRFRPDLTLNNSFEFGVTSDAPNLRIVTRLPVSF